MSENKNLTPTQRMSEGFKQNDKSPDRNQTPGEKITSEIAAELEEKNLMTPSQRMSLGYAESSKQKTEDK